MEDILVSIVCLTYNQEKYISTALDSFLMQQTNFSYEVVVHDDASTDKTIDIILEYAKKHPQIIKPLFEEENQYANGLLHIYNIAFQKCRGKYIAYCEGDDWYIDPYKLQKQVDFMEANPSYGLVHTGFKKFNNNKGKISSFDSTKRTKDQGHIFSNILMRNQIAAPTTLFRTDLAHRAMEEFLPRSKKENWLSPDYPLWLYMSLKSEIGYIKDDTTVYRCSDESISSNKYTEKHIKYTWSVKIIKEYFIKYSKIDKEIADKTLAITACGIYQYCLKRNFKERDIYRNFFRQYSKNLKGYAILKLCSRFTIFEFLYR